MPENLSSHWDLIIIGGGLAGLSSAILSSRQGLKVLVIETCRELYIKKGRFRNK